MPSKSKLENYDVLQRIGSGSYGTCKKIRRKTDGKVLVWKELDYGQMSEEEKQLLVGEVNLLRELKHPNIVRYYDRIIDRTNTTIYIVMEYCEGGDLGALISKCKKDRRFIDEEFIWKVYYQLASALQECHSRKDGGAHVLHRDLKPANVFLDSDNNVKLGDFGLARVLNHDYSFAKTFVGTPYYMSPEQMNKHSYNAKSDIWSLGCLLYELCSLSPPFTAANQRALAVKIKDGKYRPIPSQYSMELSDSIDSMLKVIPESRPSIQKILQNPVFAKFQKLERRVSQDTCGSSSDMDKREDSLRSREKALEERERDLENREKLVLERERLADDKLSRAEELMKRLQVEDNGFKDEDFKRAFPRLNAGLNKENDLGVGYNPSRRFSKILARDEYLGGGRARAPWDVGYQENRDNLAALRDYNTDIAYNMGRVRNSKGLLFMR